MNERRSVAFGAVADILALTLVFIATLALAAGIVLFALVVLLGANVLCFSLQARAQSWSAGCCRRRQLRTRLATAQRRPADRARAQSGLILPLLSGRRVNTVP
jgi:hypothetical protein